MDYLIQFLAKILTWLISLCTWFARSVFEEIMGALATLLAAIPVPQFLQDAPSVLSSIPSGVGWGLGAFMVPQGLAIIVTCYLLRFFIRRLPIVG